MWRSDLERHLERVGSAGSEEHLAARERRARDERALVIAFSGRLDVETLKRLINGEIDVAILDVSRLHTISEPARAMLAGLADGPYTFGLRPHLVQPAGRATAPDGTAKVFLATCRIDTPVEIDYYRHGGILPYVLRQLMA